MVILEEGGVVDGEVGGRMKVRTFFNSSGRGGNGMESVVYGHIDPVYAGVARKGGLGRNTVIDIGVRGMSKPGRGGLIRLFDAEVSLDMPPRSEGRQVNMASFSIVRGEVEVEVAGDVSRVVVGEGAEVVKKVDVVISVLFAVEVDEEVGGEVREGRLGFQERGADVASGRAMDREDIVCVVVDDVEVFEGRESEDGDSARVIMKGGNIVFRVVII